MDWGLWIIGIKIYLPTLLLQSLDAFSARAYISFSNFTYISPDPKSLNDNTLPAYNAQTPGSLSTVHSKFGIPLHVNVPFFLPVK
jgi:hypothetical protein